MAWERRKGNLYYYEKHRIGERVVSRYLGNGPVAQAAAQEAAEENAHQAARKEQRDTWHALESQLDQLKLQIEAELKNQGLHRPNWGRWRRKRSPAKISKS